jgi:hypothetical protein
VRALDGCGAMRVYAGQRAIRRVTG